MLSCEMRVTNTDVSADRPGRFLDHIKRWYSSSCPFKETHDLPIAFSLFTSSPLFSVAMRHSSWSQGFHNSLLEEQKPKHWTKQGRPTQTSSHLTHTSHLWVLCWQIQMANSTPLFSPLLFSILQRKCSRMSTGWRQKLANLCVAKVFYFLVRENF